MGSQELIDKVSEPVTISDMVADFESLGVQAGDVVIVHSSLSALGWVAGGAQAVVDALMRVVTDRGTILMPTHTPQFMEPSDWHNPPVPERWYGQIRDERPAYRPQVSPSIGVGAVPESFRNYPGVRRSNHPVLSFAVWGQDNEEIVDTQGYDYPLGTESPLGEIYDRNGSVLLLGVGHDANTSLHLAEYRAAIDQETVTKQAPVRRDGNRVIIEWTDIVTETDDFPAVGGAYESAFDPATATVGAADAAYIDQPALVDFAFDWFEENR